MAVAIVLAVYIPPHAPDPGQEFFSNFLSCSSLIDPLTYSPYTFPNCYHISLDFPPIQNTKLDIKESQDNARDEE